MTETDDIVARLQDMAKFLGQTFVVDPDKLARFRRWEAQHITRLEERCAAYKGQVEAGAAEIERLTDLDAKRAVQVIEIMTEAEVATARADALQAEVERLRAALQDISDGRGVCGTCGTPASGSGAGVTDCGCSYPTWDPQDPAKVARAALQPREPKP